MSVAGAVHRIMTQNSEISTSPHILNGKPSAGDSGGRRSNTDGCGLVHRPDALPIIGIAPVARKARGDPYE